MDKYLIKESLVKCHEKKLLSFKMVMIIYGSIILIVLILYLIISKPISIYLIISIWAIPLHEWYLAWLAIYRVESKWYEKKENEHEAKSFIKYVLGEREK